jgi:predicted amidohydrolase
MIELRVALFQFAPEPGRLDQNLDRILDSVHRAANSGAGLLVAPEMSLTGWSLPDPSMRVDLARRVASETIPALVAAVERFGVALVVGGPYPSESGLPANCAIGIGPGKSRALYKKLHLFGPERDWWTAGDRADRFLQVGSIRIGLSICYDAEFPEIPRLIRLAGADLLVVPATNMSPYERDQDIIFPTRALENEFPVLVCNRVGRERGWSYFGRSLVADARGGVLGQAGRGEELLMVRVRIPSDSVDRELSYLARRRPEVYTPLTGNTGAEEHGAEKGGTRKRQRSVWTLRQESANGTRADREWPARDAATTARQRGGRSGEVRRHG